MTPFKVVDVDEGILEEYGTCGYKSFKKPGLTEKLEWFKKVRSQGLTIKYLISQEFGLQGMIEYVPGEFCWRPVCAKGYMFIHCLVGGYKKSLKGQGMGTRLLELCEDDAVKKGMKGVAVIARKGSFMVGEEIFFKNGFQVVEHIKPDFLLLSKAFNKLEASSPSFINNEASDFKQKSTDLVILRASQCPYTLKNVQEIVDVAKSQFSLKVRVLNIESAKEAQKCPSPFGIFCMIYKNKVISYHPISKTRFLNIMKKEVGV